MEGIDATIGSSSTTGRSTAIEPPKKQKRALSFRVLKSKRFIIVAVTVLLLSIAGFFYYKYTEARKEVNRLSNPQEAAKTEASRLRDEVSQIYQVPDEVPTVATVVDATKLKSQAFFASAENGDRVLMFTQAKKAILYRPSTKKIIEVAPINLGDNPTPQNTSAEEQPAQVESAKTKR